MRKDDGSHVGELLDAWRTGELEPAEGARVEGHLAECERCRAELSALGTLTAAVERAQDARRRSAAELEPDWAAQRAAIVARTSGRARAARGGRRAFWRWAPQVALAAVAVIVIGVVWRGTAPDAPPEPARLEPPAAAGPEDGFRSGRPETGAENEVGVRRDADAERQRPAAPPPAEDRPAEGKALDRLGEAAEGREQEAAPAAQERVEDEAALADRAEAAAPDAADGDLDRFARAARAALAEGDTLGARRALALWSDTLAPRLAPDAAAAALADSLEAMLGDAE